MAEFGRQREEIAMQERLQAIDTQCKGYRFRSRLEARWAVYFDALDINYEYELEGYRLPNGGAYLPDFFFEKLENPPSYEPTKCSTCGAVIVLSEGGYSMRGTEYSCESCTVTEMEGVFRRTAASRCRRARGGPGGKRPRSPRARRA